MKQEQLKSAVATRAAEYIEPNLTPNAVIGVGTGSTVNFFIDALAKFRHKFDGAVASSKATADRLGSYGIPVYDLNSINEIPYYIDGADEANNNFELIKGGGGALTREKIVASVANEFVCIIDESKHVEVLGKFPLPVEVIPMARQTVSRQISDLGGEPVYRQGFITDNGNIIVDIHGLKINYPRDLEDAINGITGVVTQGLFAKRPADRLIVARASAQIDEFKR